MTRAARFTQAEIERVMRAAKKTGVPVEVDLMAGTVRTLTPSDPTEQLSDLQKWRAQKHAKRAAEGAQ